MSAPPPQALRDFPIWQGVTESYRRGFAHLEHFPVAATVPAVLSLVIAVVLARMTVTLLADPAGGNPSGALLLLLLDVVPYVLFAVAWFRLSLLGEEAARPTLLTGWHRRHWRFLRCVFGVLLLTLMASALGGLVFSMLLIALGGAFSELLQEESTAILLIGMATVATGLVVGIIVLRLSFVFPAVCVDEDYKMAMSWRHTKGQGWRLLCAMALVAVPFLLLSIILNGIMGAPIDIRGSEGGLPAEGQALGFGPGFYMVQAINVIISYLLTAVAIELISLAFRSCTGWIPADRGGVVPSGDRTSS